MPSGKKYNPIQRTNNGRVPFSVNANELQRAIRGMPSVNGNPGNSVSQFGNSFNIVNNLPPRFTIKILSGTNPYAWEAVIDDTANTWSTFNDGPAGTTTSIPAYEINGNAAVPANTLVDAWFGANYEVMYFEYQQTQSAGSGPFADFAWGTGVANQTIGTPTFVGYMEMGDYSFSGSGDWERANLSGSTFNGWKKLSATTKTYRVDYAATVERSSSISTVSMYIHKNTSTTLVGTSESTWSTSGDKRHHAGHALISLATNDIVQIQIAMNGTVVAYTQTLLITEAFTP